MSKAECGDFERKNAEETTYGASQARRTVTSSAGGTFMYFMLKNLRIHLLDKFPANKEKLTQKLAQKRLLDTLNLRKKY